MDVVAELFGRMDTWRHFPNYQLERRADLFFSLYLPEVLEARLGFPIRPVLIPEFPVRIGTICPGVQTDKSYKIDYVALSVTGDKVVFVELKTEGRSRRPEQDRYLRDARRVGLSCLLQGVLDIFRATNSKRKYFCLLEHLEGMDLLRIPSQMREIMVRPGLQGVNEASRQIQITAHASECQIVYVQPNGAEPDIISFQEFASIVCKHDDAISRRFGKSLCEWARIQAGEKPASRPD